MKRASEFTAELARHAAQFRAQIEAECDGFPHDPEASIARRARAQDDFRFFVQTYFPHYVKRDPSIVHEYLFERLPKIAGKRGTRDAIAAPRGEAKTTIVVLLFVLWVVLYRKRHYVIVCMDAFEQAAESLEGIKVELEANPRLAMDFPDDAGRGRVWKEGVALTRTDVKIIAAGSGKRIRGRKHGPYRPDLFIGDDLENDENVREVRQRDKLQKWVERTVIPLGEADDSINILLIGTVLHIDSVLARFLDNPLWQSRRFKAILQMPHRMDLWDKWEELLLNHGGEPELAQAAAHAFYEQHRAQMDRGAKVSWPAMRPLEGLMLRRARDGHASFDSELQNDPGAETKFFVGLQFWVDRLSEWQFFGACDPSLGKKGSLRSDPSAVLVGGYQRVKGILDVIEASIARRVPSRIIAAIIAYQQQYNCVAWAFESVQFQEFMRQQLITESITAGIPVPARAVIPHADKDLRIESIQPYVEQGRIRVHPTLSSLIGEFKHYPNGEHVDGLDALQMLWMLAVTGGQAAGATVNDTSSHSERARGRRTGGVFGRRAA